METVPSLVLSFIRYILIQCQPCTLLGPGNQQRLEVCGGRRGLAWTQGCQGLFTVGRREVTGRRKPLMPRLSWGQMLAGWKSFGFLAGKLSDDCQCVCAHLEE